MRKNDSVLEPQDPRQPVVRISDDDRQQMVEVLRSHCTDGRLTLDEFSDRVGLVFEAKTRADLELVTADLPVPSAPVARVSSGSKRKPVTSAVAIFSGHRQTGVWRPSENIGAVAIMGSVDLDLRHAEIEHPVVQISATAIMGSVEIIVPEGTDVELTGFNLMGSKESRVDEGTRRPGAPLIRVNAFVLMGSVLVRNKRSRSKSQSRRPDRNPQAVTRAQQRVEQELDRAHQQAERALQRAHRHSQRLGERFGLELPMLSEPPAPAAPAARADDDDTDWRDALRSHASPDGTVTILFSDMEGYTEMTERLGDLRAREVLYAHNQIIREHVAKCGGFEVKSQGDGFMLAFAGASKALRCAVGIQQAFVDYDDKHPEEPIRVRMGLHTGEALKEADDFLGRTVIIASRIADEAKGGQILVSALLKELTDGTGEFEFGDLREVKLKGLTQTYRLYTVEWDAD